MFYLHFFVVVITSGSRCFHQFWRPFKRWKVFTAGRVLCFFPSVCRVQLGLVCLVLLPFLLGLSELFFSQLVPFFSLPQSDNKEFPCPMGEACCRLKKVCFGWLFSFKVVECCFCYLPAYLCVSRSCGVSSFRLRICATPLAGRRAHLSFPSVSPNSSQEAKEEQLLTPSPQRRYRSISVETRAQLVTVATCSCCKVVTTGSQCVVFDLSV